MASLTPPESLPKYIADGLPKQDDETLRDTQEYIDQLIADRERHREEPVTEDELPNDVDVVEEDSDGTVYHEYRTCGDDTCQCMSGGSKHGPYAYRAYRDGDTVRREYLGKAPDTNTTA
ncbi:DUF6788 family protein [Saliphagus infecundisoli]|uniref:DUF6788 family protein n=1 Tax=Saliphagus infecundisoli TaxID=1849069 RepID=A0ABD5QK14_9EURY|nr:DUF6788 family protein [Saliphagus infecundisoli]